MANLNLNQIKETLELTRKVSIKSKELFDGMSVLVDFYKQSFDDRLSPYVDNVIEFSRRYLALIIGKEVNLEEKDNIITISI